MGEPCTHDAEVAAAVFTMFYQVCAEQAWHAGQSDDFLPLLEALRFEHGIDPLSDNLTRRLTAACAEDPYRQYALVVTLAVMALISDGVAREHLVATMVQWSQTHARPHGSRLGRAWWRLRSGVPRRRGRHPPTG
jgi:hypothetical protein